MRRLVWLFITYRSVVFELLHYLQNDRFGRTQKLRWNFWVFSHQALRFIPFSRVSTLVQLLAARRSRSRFRFSVASALFHLDSSISVVISLRIRLLMTIGDSASSSQQSVVPDCRT